MTSSARRQRDSLVEATKIALIFEQSANERLAALAKATGTSKSALAQWLVERAEVDADGAVVGWAEGHPTPGGELPLADSA